MKNGRTSRTIITSTYRKDAMLAKYVTVCDETAWWSYMGQDNDIFKDQLGHLTVQLRKYSRSASQK